MLFLQLNGGNSMTIVSGLNKLSYSDLGVRLFRLSPLKKHE